MLETTAINLVHFHKAFTLSQSSCYRPFCSQTVQKKQTSFQQNRFLCH